MDINTERYGMPTADAERIRWETIEQVLTVENALFYIVREQTLERGIRMIDLFKWMATPKGMEATDTAVGVFFDQYTH